MKIENTSFHYLSHNLMIKIKISSQLICSNLFYSDELTWMNLTANLLDF